MIPLSLNRKDPKDAKGFFVGLLPGWDAEAQPPGPLTIYTTESTEKRNTDRWGADSVSFIKKTVNCEPINVNGYKNTLYYPEGMWAYSRWLKPPAIRLFPSGEVFTYIRDELKLYIERGFQPLKSTAGCRCKVKMKDALINYFFVLHPEGVGPCPQGTGDEISIRYF